MSRHLLTGAPGPWFLALWLLCSPSYGQDPGDKRAEARRLLEEGFAADEAGHKEQARRLYAESFAAHPSYDVAGNLGLIEFRLEQYSEAANHLSYCLRHFPIAESLALKAKIERDLDISRKHAAGLRLDAVERDVELIIDGEQIGVSPLGYEIFVTPGAHQISFRKGDRTAQGTVTALVGEIQTVRLELPAPEASSPGPYSPAREKGPSWVPAYILGGVTAASFVTSLATRGAASAKRDELSQIDAGTGGECAQALSADCERLAQLSSQYDTLAGVSNFTLVASGVGLVATVGYVTYVLVKKRSGPVQASGFFDGSSGGVSLRGRF